MELQIGDKVLIETFNDILLSEPNLLVQLIIINELDTLKFPFIANVIKKADCSFVIKFPNSITGNLMDYKFTKL